jgi:hypothetical protein
MSESSGDTRAINRQNSDGSVDYGLFQVSSKHSVPHGKRDFEVDSNSQDVKFSLFCVVLYETLTLTHPKSKVSYQNQIKGTETFSSSITTVPQTPLKKNY